MERGHFRFITLLKATEATKLTLIDLIQQAKFCFIKMEKQADQAVIKIDDQSPFNDDIPFKMIMIPVAEEDYEKLNQFAEALMVNRYPAMITEIQQLRQALLSKHNKEQEKMDRKYRGRCDAWFTWIKKQNKKKHMDTFIHRYLYKSKILIT